MTDDILTTRRLILRRPIAGDRSRLVELANDDAIARNLATMPHPYGFADADHYLSKLVPEALARGGLSFAIERRRKPGLLIGCVGCQTRDGSDFPELGYWIGRPYWGYGYASEAAAAVVDAMFARPETSTLTACFFTDNPASARVLAKLGFRRTGECQRDSVGRGGKARSIELALERASWQKARRRRA